MCGVAKAAVLGQLDKPDLIAIPHSDVQSKEACNKDDYDDDADDVKNVHCVLRSRQARFQDESAALEQETSWPDSKFRRSLKSSTSAHRGIDHPLRTISACERDGSERWSILYRLIFSY